MDFFLFDFCPIVRQVGNTLHWGQQLTFILISSVLTWNDTKQNAELASKEENEDEAAPEDEEVEQETFTEDMYNKRVPHVKYTAWKEVEKLCKKANSKTLHTAGFALQNGTNQYSCDTPKSISIWFM